MRVNADAAADPAQDATGLTTVAEEEQAGTTGTASAVAGLPKAITTHIQSGASAFQRWLMCNTCGALVPDVSTAIAHGVGQRTATVTLCPVANCASRKTAMSLCRSCPQCKCPLAARRSLSSRSSRWIPSA